MFQTVANTIIALVAVALGLVAAHPDRFGVGGPPALRAPIETSAASPSSDAAWSCALASH